MSGDVPETGPPETCPGTVPPHLRWRRWTSRRAPSTPARAGSRHGRGDHALYLTTTYAHEAVGEHKGYDYSRAGNPTRTALETCLASLEAPSTGTPSRRDRRDVDDHASRLPEATSVVTVNDVYGGTYRMFSQIYEPKGYEFAFAPPEELAAAIDERTRLVWIESPTNPLLNIVDIRAAADAAHAAAGAILVVDNTFATPYLQQPLNLGADIVLHSTTKYLGGHSDVVGGFAATNDPTIAERLRFLQKSLGAIPGPFDAWLVLRGLKTLAIRMDRHCEARRRRPPRSPPCRAGALSGAGRASRPRARRAPDARLRRHDLLPGRERAGGRRPRRAHAGVDAGGEPRRRRA